MIYTGDPLTPASITKEATAQDYHPEWIIGPTVLADTSIFGRTFDQDQWAHAFGVALVPGRTTQDDQRHVLPLPVVPRLAAAEQHLRRDQPERAGVCQRGDARGARSSRRRPSVTGCSATRRRAADAINPQLSWGKHGVWPSTDYNGSDDAGMLWWDPTREGRGRGRPGRQRPLPVRRRGKRYTSGQVPGQGPRWAVRHRVVGDGLRAAPADGAAARLPAAASGRIRTSGWVRVGAVACRRRAPSPRRSDSGG